MNQIVVVTQKLIALLAIITLRSADSKRVASITIASTPITYAAAYLLMAVLVRSVSAGLQEVNWRNIPITLKT